MIKEASEGGDYSEIFCFDENMELVDKVKAIRAVVRKCKEDGSLLTETMMTIGK